MPITLGLRANKVVTCDVISPLPLGNRIVCTTKLHVVFMTITQKGVFQCQSECLGLIQLLSFVKVGVCSSQVTKPDSTRGTSTEDVWVRLWIALYKMKVDCYSNTESIILLTCGFTQQIMVSAGSQPFQFSQSWSTRACEGGRATCELMGNRRKEGDSTNHRLWTGIWTRFGLSYGSHVSSKRWLDCFYIRKHFSCSTVICLNIWWHALSGFVPSFCR